MPKIFAKLYLSVSLGSPETPGNAGPVKYRQLSDYHDTRISRATPAYFADALWCGTLYASECKQGLYRTVSV